MLFIRSLELMRRVSCQDTIKEFVNRTLEHAVKTYEILERWFPKLSLMGVEGLHVLISDLEKSVIAKIRLEGELWYCENCEANACSHILYLNYLPEVVILREAVMPKKKEKKIEV